MSDPGCKTISQLRVECRGISLAARVLGQVDELNKKDSSNGKPFWELKLRDADHMSFAGEAVDPKRFSRDIKVTEQGNRVLWGRVSQMTTAFWAYYLAVEGRSVPATKEAFDATLRALKGPNDELKFG